MRPPVLALVLVECTASAVATRSFASEGAADRAPGATDHASDRVAGALRLHGEGGGAHFLGSWQSREIGSGGLAAGAVELSSGRFGLEARVAFARFLTGEAPADPALRRVEATSLTSLGLGFRFQPAWGLWLGVGVAGVRTGALARASFDARIGWDFKVAEGLRLGPFVGYLHVLQPDDSVRPADARLAVFGLHGALYTEPRAVVRVAEKPVERPPIALRCSADGCIERDDRDARLLGLPDRCPDEPDDFLGASDADGCPTDAEVKVVGDEILLNDRVYFDFALARVKHRSWPLLKSLAKMILAHPEYVVVHVHGHTDEIGDHYWNNLLSEQRAEAVRKKLIEYGVPAARLVAKGFGKTRPRTPGLDETARQENRRVEFLIERKGKTGAP